MSSNRDVFPVLINDEEDPSDHDSFQQPVLFVPTVGKGEDVSGPPVDGYEFVQRVIEERKRCDAVIVKENRSKPQKNVAKQILDFPEDKCNPEYWMGKETQLHTVAEFSKVRLMYEARRSKIPHAQLEKLKTSMPKKQDETNWLKVISSTPPNVADTLGLDIPSIEVCLAITQPKMEIVMEYMKDWITEGEVEVSVACHWIYMFLACIDLPLDPGMCAVMRGISRTLITHRSQLESVDSEELPHINVIICIIGRYFNQFDLADPMS